MASPSYIYPFFTGTSSGAFGNNGNNYYANSSTSAMTPAGSAVLTINDGEDHWYKIIYDEFAANTLASTETLFLNAGAQLVSDNACIVQIVHGIKLGNNTYYQCDTQTMTSAVLDANVPFVYNYLSTWAGNANNITGGAAFFRNVVGGTNAYVIFGSIASSAGKNPYF